MAAVGADWIAVVVRHEHSAAPRTIRAAKGRELVEHALQLYIGVNRAIDRHIGAVAVFDIGGSCIRLIRAAVTKTAT